MQQIEANIAGQHELAPYCVPGSVFDKGSRHKAVKLGVGKRQDDRHRLGIWAGTEAAENGLTDGKLSNEDKLLEEQID